MAITPELKSLVAAADEALEGVEAVIDNLLASEEVKNDPAIESVLNGQKVLISINKTLSAAIKAVALG